MSDFQVSESYAPRPACFAGLHERDGWRLKVYDIVYGGGPLDESAYEAGMALVLDALPRPAVTRGRPGAGFIIRHQGRGVHYLVLCWWDRENELPIRVWVRAMGATAKWRPASGSESICVWDMQVIEHERRAYIEHILARCEAPDLEGYLVAAMG